jgi:hypothetical protein
MYKLKDIFNSDNIKSFIEGNSLYFWDKWLGVSPHIKEQVKFRLNNCKNDCVPAGKCIKCGCPTRRKVFATKSCNYNRHPDLMNAEDWEKYKKKNNDKKI